MLIMNSSLILGSLSPRRRELLALLGIPFETVSPDIEETARPGESPQELTRRLAFEKGRAINGLFPNNWVLAADTMVLVNGQSLGKPADSGEARAMLRKLSGRPHQVLTAFYLGHSAQDIREEAMVETRVYFRPLSEEEIAWYIRTGEPMDKAGAYAIQGLGSLFVEAVSGSISNVIGLPLGKVAGAMKKLGILR